MKKISLCFVVCLCIFVCGNVLAADLTEKENLDSKEKLNTALKQLESDNPAQVSKGAVAIIRMGSATVRSDHKTYHKTMGKLVSAIHRLEMRDTPGREDAMQKLKDAFRLITGHHIKSNASAEEIQEIMDYQYKGVELLP